MNGSQLRERRELADLTQEQVGTMLDISADSVRRVEQAELVDAVTAAKFERAVAFLISLRRQVARRVARAAREAAAV